MHSQAVRVHSFFAACGWRGMNFVEKRLFALVLDFLKLPLSRIQVKD